MRAASKSDFAICSANLVETGLTADSRLVGAFFEQSCDGFTRYRIDEVRCNFGEWY
jgi:hypothetical protein